MKERSNLLNAAASVLAPVLLISCGGGGDSEGDFPPRDITEEINAYYKSKPDFFTFASIEDLPKDLEWTSNDHLPEIGSPKARKGGVAQSAIQDFPRTLRVVGPDSNGSFRNYILDDVVVLLAHRHPETLEFFPGLAKEWAVDESRKTVFVRLDEKARWSDGVPVTTKDFFFMFFMYHSSYINAPWYNNWYTTQYTNITQYDDLTFAISVPKVKPDMDSKVLELHPMPQHFYIEMGPDFTQRYQWRFQPTTAAYVVNDKDIQKGRSIALTRLEDWWAKDKKHWRYRYNPDRIEFRVVRETAKAFEEFKKGDLDGFATNLPEYYYDKLPDNHELVTKGYVHKVTFYNDRPRPNYGLWINRSKPLLDNRDVREGIQYASNWDLVIEKYFRGDYIRMKGPDDGFGEFTHPELKAREFSVEKALESFAKAGFTQRGPDQILMNDQGQRLSFTLSTGYEPFKDMLAILVQEARKAGLELRLEVLDSTSGWKKAQEKKHEIMFSAFGVFVELYPRYWETWHSVNAYEDDGSIKTQTNNLCEMNIPEMDELIEKYRASEDYDEMVKMAHRMQEIIHEDACFVPGFVQPFYRTAHWRWIHYPDDFNVKISDSPGQFFLSWIAEGEREETLKARDEGKTFEPVIKVYDQYAPKD